MVNAPDGSVDPLDDVDVPQPNLPPAGASRFRALLGRALARRCPYCGGDGIFATYWTLKDRCPHCRVTFDREEGYFLGGYALNLIVAEFLGLGLALYLIFGTGLRDAPLLVQEAIAISLVVALPILFFPYSRTVWMALDLLFNPPEKDRERYLRARKVRRPPADHR